MWPVYVIFHKNNFIKKIHKNCSLKTSPALLENSTSIGKRNFVAIYLYWICNSRLIDISPNQHAGLLRFFFTEDSLKIKKSVELVSRPHFPYIFLIKIFISIYYINWPNLITRLCLFLKFFSKMCLVFHAWAFDDVITFEYLKR